METQRGEVTCQDLKTGSPDTTVSPSHSNCFSRQGSECGKGAPQHVMNSFTAAGKNSSCTMGVGEW